MLDCDANLFATIDANYLACNRGKIVGVKTIGEQVRSYREARSWNTAQMAKHVGTSRQNIDNLEAGRAKVPQYIVALAVKMQTTTDALLGHRPPLEGEPPHGHQALSDDAITVAEVYDGMPPVRRRKFLRALELALDGLPPGLAGIAHDRASRSPERMTRSRIGDLHKGMNPLQEPSRTKPATNGCRTRSSRR